MFTLGRQKLYEFSSLQCNLPEILAHRIYRWGNAVIPEADLFDDEDGNYGRDNEIHCTVLYGIHDAEPSHLREVLSVIKPFVITLKRVSCFNMFDKDVVKIEVQSPDLHRLNRIIARNLPCTRTHPVYKPHVTIAYVKKGHGSGYCGSNHFHNTNVRINTLKFSGKDGICEDIFLG